jgi:hypothetical protein
MGSISLASFSSGAMAAFCWVIGLYFIGFWRKTNDRFFGFFAAGFWMLGIGRFATTLLGDTQSPHAVIQTLRLIAYLTFLAAIIDKNRDEAGSG